MKTTTEDAAIAAAHPLQTGNHARYQRAIELVSARHSKGDLVDLVNWLLGRAEDERAKTVAWHKAEAVRLRAEAAKNLFTWMREIQTASAALHEDCAERLGRGDHTKGPTNADDK